MIISDFKELKKSILNASSDPITEYSLYVLTDDKKGGIQIAVQHPNIYENDSTGRPPLDTLFNWPDETVTIDGKTYVREEIKYFSVFYKNVEGIIKNIGF